MEQVTVKMEIGDLETKDKIKMTIEGKSNMPFRHQDLIFRAAISLLEDIDEKNFFLKMGLKNIINMLHKQKKQ